MHLKLNKKKHLVLIALFHSILFASIPNFVPLLSAQTPSQSTAAGAPSPDPAVASQKKQDSVMAHSTSLDPGICPKKKNTVVILKGKRSKYIIMKELDSARLELFSTFLDLYNKNPSIFGNICLHIIIDTSGFISSASPIASSINDAFFKNKIIERIQAIKFMHRPADPEATELVYSMEFYPSDSKDESGFIRILKRAAIFLGAITGIIVTFLLVHK